MKIVICVSKLMGGGAERVAALWATGFCKQGHEVSVILNDLKSPRSYYMPNNNLVTPNSYFVPKEAKIYNIAAPYRNRFANYVWKNTRQTQVLKKLLKVIQPDVVIAVLLQPWGPLIYKAKGNLGFKVIGTDHNSYEYPPIEPMPKRLKWLKFEFGKRFDVVTVLTQADKDYIGNERTNIRVLPNPLAFEPIQSPIKDRKKVILAVGRLNAFIYKGFDVLIKAFGQIAQNHRDWKLQIMGKGSSDTVAMLKNMAQEYGIEQQFELTPYQSNPLPVYQQSEIFCLSSRYEGFGLVLIEAMSQGCACVACDYKGRQQEIITGEKYGLTCPPDDINALAENLERMISDEAYRRIVQKNAPERAAYYSLDNIMLRWESILKNLNK